MVASGSIFGSAETTMGFPETTMDHLEMTPGSSKTT